MKINGKLVILFDRVVVICSNGRNASMVNDKNNLKIASWIAARMKGIILPDEEKALEEWLAESDEHKAFYERVTEAEFVAGRLREYEAYSLEKVKERVMPGVRQTGRKVRRIRWFVRVAAVLLIPLLAVGLLLFTGEEQKPSPVVADVLPGGERAILEMADGSRIDLTAGEAKDLSCMAGITVKNDSNILAYQVDGNVSGTKLEYNTIIIPRGGEYRLTLADGTRVWLNSETRLRYPVVFTGERRDAYLEGEAYFEVTRTGKPFEVHCEGMAIRVLGTAFNVMAYRNEPVIQTTLVNGSVRVTSEMQLGQPVVLTPGRQAEMNVRTGNIESREVSVESYVGWKDQLFVFDEENMESMMRKLARWYDVDITIESPVLREKTFYGVIRKYENISKILDMLKKTQNVDYTIKGRNIVIKEIR